MTKLLNSYQMILSGMNIKLSRREDPWGSSWKLISLFARGVLLIQIYVKISTIDYASGVKWQLAFAARFKDIFQFCAFRFMSDTARVTFLFSYDSR